MNAAREVSRASGTETIIRVEIQGELAEAVRRYYRRRDGRVYIVNFLEGGAWDAVLFIDAWSYHRTVGEDEPVTYGEGGDNEWTTRLSGGARMVRHILTIAGRGA